MSPFPIDRRHPPRRVEHRHATHSFVLRPWSFDDVDAQSAAIAESAQELRAFMPWSHATLTREERFALIASFQASYWRGDEYLFGIFDADGAVVGGLGLHPRVPLNPAALEVGYWCRSARAGQGWITFAVRAAIALAFDRFESDRVQVMHDVENLASARVIERCGFRHEATLRNVTAAPSPALRAGGYRESGVHRLYALTRDDLGGVGWLAETRAALTYVDALGSTHATQGG
jgi:RimJ/RimL family protein N-acetyltransferase